ncbi:MAG: hypothetical protein KIS73_09425 [Enhydrobacter sp.]|nr:hypothetical protein [Enhydrobacter sp.]
MAFCALLAGCASIFEGTSQQISVRTTPPDARCTFWRNGSLIADIASTPGTVTVEKTKIDLFVVCDKPGYASATYVNRSGLAVATYANILTLGLAWAVDSSRGADNKYEGEIDLSLAPNGMTVPIPAAPPPTVAVPVPTAPPPARQRTGGPPQLPPAAVPTAAPASPQVECASSDGSRIRMTGTACPAGWTRVR